MTAKCLMCPVTSGTPCIAAEWPERHANLCVFAASGDPVKVRHVIAVSAVYQGEALPRAATAAPCNDTVPASQSLAQIQAMKTCPHWQKSSDCGCGNNRCGLGKGRDGVVSHQDCFACLAGSGGVE